MTQRYSLHTHAVTDRQENFCLFCNRHVTWDKYGKCPAGHTKPQTQPPAKTERTGQPNNEVTK